MISVDELRERHNQLEQKLIEICGADLSRIADGYGCCIDSVIEDMDLYVVINEDDDYKNYEIIFDEYCKLSNEDGSLVYCGHTEICNIGDKEHIIRPFYMDVEWVLLWRDELINEKILGEL